jgi:hypothetical protein
MRSADYLSLQFRMSDNSIVLLQYLDIYLFPASNELHIHKKIDSFWSKHGLPRRRLIVIVRVVSTDAGFMNVQFR